MNFGRQHGLDARQSGIEFSLTDPRLVDDAWATQRTFHDERGQKGESLGHCSETIAPESVHDQTATDVARLGLQRTGLSKKWLGSRRYARLR